MPFARQLPVLQRVPDLSRFVDTPRQKKDPCFHCTLPFDCDPTSPECKFVATPFDARTVLDRERKELIDELKSEGVIVNIRGNGFIEYKTAETDIERRRRINREHMRRKRAEAKAVQELF